MVVEGIDTILKKSYDKRLQLFSQIANKFYILVKILSYEMAPGVQADSKQVKQGLDQLVDEVNHTLEDL